MTRRMLMLVLSAFLVLGAAACDDAGEDTTGVGDDRTTEATGEATTDGILGGEQVTVSGTVQEVVAGRAFTLTDATVEEGTATTDGDLAVIASDDAGVSQSDEVVVTGTLYEVDIADEIQEFQDLFGVTLDEDALERFEGRQLLLASSVEPSA